MRPSETPTIEQYLRAFGSRARQFSPQEQRIGAAIYRELAKGAALEPEQLRQSSNISDEELHAVLQRDPLKSVIHWDKQGRILEFGGLSTVPSIIISRWMDEVFSPRARESPFPACIPRAARRVESRDPEIGELVELTIAPDRIESIVPECAVISFIQPGPDLFGTSLEAIQKSYCHFSFFFASRQYLESGGLANIRAPLLFRWQRVSGSQKKWLSEFLAPRQQSENVEEEVGSPG